MKNEIGVVGLGKMGAGIVRQLMEKGWTVHGFDPVPGAVHALAAEGMGAHDSPAALASALSSPRLVWLMVPAGKPVDDVLAQVVPVLSKGDIIIDGGNSDYKDSIRRGTELAAVGLRFIDVGFSGGPGGARSGGCLMVGGDKSAFDELEPLFAALAKNGTAYKFFPGAGAGHFVKMVHNGIEYGMMQAIGEGTEILKKSAFNIDLIAAMDIYNNGSVIESRLVGWTKAALEQYGQDLSDISGTVGHSGEGEWTARTARELGVPAPIIEGSFKFRVESAKNPSFTGQVVSAQRNQFGGHNVAKES
ncbi:decarboxylating 6-phosphogluconate dehydrogenase [Candidatus Kaiserbacteria bacterium]|nr:decarboxylating 6-phosphogluconate dehydrogenase [Candidatus Kaiserbacteria bacterium]